VRDRHRTEREPAQIDARPTTPPSGYRAAPVCASDDRAAERPPEHGRLRNQSTSATASISTAQHRS
jgi:hypothetical protein